ncbi:HEPN domain-containing protein [Candidatus Woesearchaeota archaeon]|nr:HEPN domain-containing protein [Candidatus Woesearchaeota archaeon]
MKEESRSWWEQAESDFDTAKYLFDGKKYKACSFFCQQAAEKSLKALLINRGEELIKIHDLVKLSRLIKIEDSLEKDCKELTTVYTDTRYPDSGSSSYSKEEAKEDINRAERILQWVEKNI